MSHSQITQLPVVSYLCCAVMCLNMLGPIGKAQEHLGFIGFLAQLPHNQKLGKLLLRDYPVLHSNSRVSAHNQPTDL